MHVVCEATRSPDNKVRVTALQCLVKIILLYCQYMEHYMEPALFVVSFRLEAKSCRISYCISIVDNIQKAIFFGQYCIVHFVL